MTEKIIDATKVPTASSGSMRKTYDTPKLRVYGDVAALTRSVGHLGSLADGGHGAMSKTR
jgi:hypothetical protein